MKMSLAHFLLWMMGIVGIAMSRKNLVRQVFAREGAEAALVERTVQLEATNKELESFSYSVSHDLRAPLRAIDGYVRMILKKQGDKFDEETMRQFNVVRGNAKTMGQLIDDLLAFSRLGRQEVIRVDLNMQALIRDVWQELVMIHPNREMSLTTAQMPAASGDQTLIRQVYSNLLGNAVKFTQGRDPAAIEAGCIARDEEMIYYVRDNGIGFDMKFYDKLFGVFQRLHSSAEFEGTGVGLAIVQRIINRHGGRVWAEGEVDKGATFYFTLPTRPE
jgi:light-regulated signal transduction histidine kinase (bacteriophytochrome)